MPSGNDYVTLLPKFSPDLTDHTQQDPQVTTRVANKYEVIDTERFERLHAALLETGSSVAFLGFRDGRTTWDITDLRGTHYAEVVEHDLDDLLDIVENVFLVDAAPDPDAVNRARAETDEEARALKWFRASGVDTMNYKIAL